MQIAECVGIPDILLENAGGRVMRNEAKFI